MLFYEIASLLAYFAAWIWAVRSRDPFNLGALAGGSFLWVFDWLWCGKALFNATFNPALTMIPGLNVMGQQYPVAVVANWAVGFALLPLLASRWHDPVSRRLGMMHLPAVLTLCAFLDMLIEIPLVSVLGVYSYHQAAAHEYMGVPWSSFGLGAGLIGLPYFGFHYARKWAAIPARAGFDMRDEKICRGFVLAACTPWALFFFMTIPLVFWYANAQPWVESGRPF